METCLITHSRNIKHIHHKNKRQQQSPTQSQRKAHSPIRVKSVYEISPSCAIHSQKQASVRNRCAQSAVLVQFVPTNPSFVNTLCAKSAVHGQSVRKIRRACATHAQNVLLVQSVAEFLRPCFLPSQNQTFLRNHSDNQPFV